MQHTWHAPCTCDGRGCMFCTGGLECCKVCGAFEGATPDECPGRQMSENTSDDVYRGRINYRAGMWRKECCKAMRHIHDTENYMAEAGYYPDGLNNAGNIKWVKK